MISQRILLPAIIENSSEKIVPIKIKTIHIYAEDRNGLSDTVEKLIERVHRSVYFPVPIVNSSRI